MNIKRVEPVKNIDLKIQKKQIELQSQQKENKDSVAISKESMELFKKQKENKQIELLVSKLKQSEEIREEKISNIQKKLKTKELLEPPTVKNGILRMMILMGQLPIEMQNNIKYDQ